MQLFISHLARWLRTRRFGEATIWPSGATLEEHSEARLSYLFAHLHLLSFHCFSSLIFSLLLFSFLTLPTFAFTTVHIVGSFTSKLPSINCTLYRDGSCENSLNLFQQFGSESKEWKGKYEAIPAEEVNTVQKQLLCSNHIWFSHRPPFFLERHVNGTMVWDRLRKQLIQSCLVLPSSCFPLCLRPGWSSSCRNPSTNWTATWTASTKSMLPVQLKGLMRRYLPCQTMGWSFALWTLAYHAMFSWSLKSKTKAGSWKSITTLSCFWSDEVPRSLNQAMELTLELSFAQPRSEENLRELYKESMKLFSP